MKTYRCDRENTPITKRNTFLSHARFFWPMNFKKYLYCFFDIKRGLRNHLEIFGSSLNSWSFQSRMDSLEPRLKRCRSCGACSESMDKCQTCKYKYKIKWSVSFISRISVNDQALLRLDCSRFYGLFRCIAVLIQAFQTSLISSTAIYILMYS